MKYHAPTKCFVIEPAAIERVALEIRYAMQGVRKLAKRPLEPYKRDGAMSHACHVEKTLLDIAAHIGIDMGAQWPGQIDLRDKP